MCLLWTFSLAGSWHNASYLYQPEMRKTLMYLIKKNSRYWPKVRKSVFSVAQSFFIRTSKFDLSLGVLNLFTIFSLKSFLFGPYLFLFSKTFMIVPMSIYIAHMLQVHVCMYNVSAQICLDIYKCRCIFLLKTYFLKCCPIFKIFSQISQPQTALKCS